MIKVSKKSLKDFGILFGILFPLLIGWLIPLISGHDLRLWTFIVGIVFLLLGILKPNLLLRPYQFWMKLGYLLGWLNSRIILGIVFFLVLQPIALIMKLSKYDPLKQKFNKDISYRETKVESIINLSKIF